MTQTTHHDIDAEKGLLAALMFNSAIMGEVGCYVGVKDFYFEPHRTIFSEMFKLHEQGEAFDLPLIVSHMREAGVLAQVGGATYISGVSDHLSGVMNHVGYAKRVKALSQRRAIQVLLVRAQSGEISGAELREGLAGLIDESGAPTSLQPVRELVIGALEVLDERHKSGADMFGLPTGFSELDRRTDGLQDGKLVIIAGRPSMGKSALALQIASTVARQRKQVAFFSAEMDRLDCLYRMFAARAKVPYLDLVHAREWKSNAEKVTRAAGELSPLDLYIDDNFRTVEDIRAKAHRLKSGGGLDIVFVDYLQLLTTARRQENRRLKVGAISRGLKQLAMELHLPVVALCQLSRAVESRIPPRPRLSDLKETGDLEQDADQVWLLYRPEMTARADDPFAAIEANIAGLIEINVAKYRNGPVGITTLHFDGPHMSFAPREERYG